MINKRFRLGTADPPIEPNLVCKRGFLANIVQFGFTELTKAKLGDGTDLMCPNKGEIGRRLSIGRQHVLSLAFFETKPTFYLPVYLSLLNSCVPDTWLWKTCIASALREKEFLRIPSSAAYNRYAARSTRQVQGKYILTVLASRSHVHRRDFPRIGRQFQLFDSSSFRHLYKAVDRCSVHCDFIKRSSTEEKGENIKFAELEALREIPRNAERNPVGCVIPMKSLVLFNLKPRNRHVTMCSRASRNFTKIASIGQVPNGATGAYQMCVTEANNNVFRQWECLNGGKEKYRLIKDSFAWSIDIQSSMRPPKPCQQPRNKFTVRLYLMKTTDDFDFDHISCEPRCRLDDRLTSQIRQLTQDYADFGHISCEPRCRLDDRLTTNAGVPVVNTLSPTQLVVCCYAVFGGLPQRTCYTKRVVRLVTLGMRHSLHMRFFMSGCVPTNECAEILKPFPINACGSNDQTSSIKVENYAQVKYDLCYGLIDNHLEHNK
ncbi:hypothetical protein CLF_102320 [Clonorchis sinensis]|uniref:Uncharacterized protein n=1 Tax=Clonorchis sinensis TaxID=79923 RepID=G7YN16_CLOSI|nr:hypothetical protein CLF_102320 [Clonorchis sinensis]